MRDTWSREEAQPSITVVRITSWVMLPLLLILLLINFSLPAAAASKGSSSGTVSNGPCYYAWWTNDYGFYRSVAINSCNMVSFGMSSVARGLSVSFPQQDGYEYYIIDIYMAASAAGYLYSGYFDTSRVDLISNPNSLYTDRVQGFEQGGSIYVYTSTNETQPYIAHYGLGNVDPVQFTVDFSSEGHGSYNIQLILKASDVAAVSDHNAAVMFYLSSTFVGSGTNVLYLQSCTPTSDLQVSKETGAILDAIGDAAADIIQNQDKNAQDIIDALGENRELFEDFLSDWDGDRGALDAYESTFGEYSDIASGIDSAVDDMMHATVTDPVTGQQIVIDLSGNLYGSLAAMYNDGMQEWNAFSVSGANIFRHLVDELIRIFPMYIFFPLLLGILAVILGRSVS